MTFDPIAFLHALEIIAPTFAQYITAIITIGSIISALVPAPKQTSSNLYKISYQILKWCAVNVGHGQNLSDPASTGLVGGPTAISTPRIATASVPASETTPQTPGIKS